MNGNDQWLVTRFYPNIPQGTVALTAWGVLDEFEGVDQERIERFYEAYKGNLFSDETEMAGARHPLHQRNSNGPIICTSHHMVARSILQLA